VDALAELPTQNDRLAFICDIKWCAINQKESKLAAWRAGGDSARAARIAADVLASRAAAAARQGLTGERARPAGSRPG
jgi:hypothetical protein